MEWLDLDALLAKTNEARAQLPEAPPGQYWRVELDVVVTAEGSTARLRYELAPRVTD
jgi:hypothetical protein